VLGFSPKMKGEGRMGARFLYVFVSLVIAGLALSVFGLVFLLPSEKSTAWRGNPIAGK
jgi:hypothetical protein